ncbi:MAG: hypothetical protein IJD21_00785 [Oscillospiraceae bacterium]|nr:hypothetical protein [Oscillospiraceae bacterium]
MAKDDYHVIVYKVLAYLYVQLKNGQDVDAGCLTHDGLLFRINQRYWAYIMANLLRQGLIEGISITRPWGGETVVTNLEACQITPAGIEYLCDNSFIEKAKSFLKEIKEITPFI